MNNLTFILVLLAAIGLCYAGSFPDATIEIKNPMCKLN